MSTIRKPDVEVFRDSTPIRAARKAHSVATASPKVVGRGIVKIYVSFLLFAWLASGLVYIVDIRTVPAALLYAVSMAIPAALLVKLWKQPCPSGLQAVEAGSGSDLRGVSVPLPAHLRPAAKDDGFRIEYGKTALLNAAMPFAGGGFMLLFTGIGSIFGVYFLLRALLLMIASVDTRVGLACDGTTLTVRSLIGSASIGIDDIRDLRADTLGRSELWSILTVGSRDVLRVKGYSGHELLVAYRLLGLDASDAESLAHKILHKGSGRRTSGAPPSRQAWQTAAPDGPFPAHSRSAPTELGQPFIGDATAPGDFDAGAIIERHLAERARIQALAPPPATTRVQGFGRKVRSS